MPTALPILSIERPAAGLVEGPWLLDRLLRERPVWRGRTSGAPVGDGLPTGLAPLDEALPSGGWLAGLNEVLVGGEGAGELALLWPMLARAAQDGPVVLIAPPHLPYAPAWHAAGVRLDRLQVVRASSRDALWAAEQCMRSGACPAVLCWPPNGVDDRPLRRLQVAAEAGRCHGIAIRALDAARNPSPAPLRLVVEASPRQVRVLKCRGAHPPSAPIPFPRAAQR